MTRRSSPRYSVGNLREVRRERRFQNRAFARRIDRQAVLRVDVLLHFLLDVVAQVTQRADDAAVEFVRRRAQQLFEFAAAERIGNPPRRASPCRAATASSRCPRRCAALLDRKRQRAAIVVQDAGDDFARSLVRCGAT